ncbi:titin-like [Anopheles ziemanni]|uniref:titin-like n=1 Tax=Anopheles coustani TaxID=139045 RepID=UPI002658BA13|nr:titin-like [Anopheles coustani]XP_058170341.1 titin-like [Anopheles ziemanni]
MTGATIYKYVQSFDEHHQSTVSHLKSIKPSRSLKMKVFIVLSVLLAVGMCSPVPSDKSEEKKEKRGIVELNNGYEQYYGGEGLYYGNDYDRQVTNHVTVTKKVAVPYPVAVEKHVPVEVKVPYPVHVEKEVPVVVEKKVPVYIEKKVPVHVDRPYPVPVKVPVKVPVYHKQVVEVAKPYPVEVEKPYPVYVKQPHYVHKTVPSTVYHGSYEQKPLWEKSSLQAFIVFFVALAITSVIANEEPKKEKRGLYELGQESYESYGYETPLNHGYYANDHVQKQVKQVITKKVPVPYPVEVEKHVPVEVKVPYPVEVEKKVPVYVEKKVPVYVEKKVPVHVDRPYPVEVKVPVHVPVYKKEYVEVPKPYAVHVDKPYPVYVKEPVYVEKQVPVTVHIKEHHKKPFWG